MPRISLGVSSTAEIWEPSYVVCSVVVSRSKRLGAVCASTACTSGGRFGDDCTEMLEGVSLTLSGLRSARPAMETHKKTAITTPIFLSVILQHSDTVFVFQYRAML